MELKEGMYVRDEYYGIGQIKEICTCEQCKERGFYEPIIDYVNHTEYVSSYNNMQLYEGKASHNIIDLIEVGDYVNGWKVLYWTDGTKIVDDGYATNLDKIGIKSIVTREQFSAMEYRLGDK